jgi:hypothetical protein
MSDDDLDSFMERGNVGIMKRRDVGFDSSKKKRNIYTTLPNRSEAVTLTN